jgi:hypothetical protein
MCVVPVRPRLVQEWLIDRVLQQIVDRPALERIRIQGVVHLGVADDVVDVSGCHPGQLIQRDTVGMRYLGQPIRQLVVEAHLSFVDELEQQGGDVGDGDRAVAEVHVGGRGYAGHRLADGLGDYVIAVDGHAHDDGLEVFGGHGVSHDAHHGVRLRGVGSRRLGAGLGRYTTSQDREGADDRNDAPDKGHDTLSRIGVPTH